MKEVLRVHQAVLLIIPVRRVVQALQAVVRQGHHRAVAVRQDLLRPAAALVQGSIVDLKQISV